MDILRYSPKKILITQIISNTMKQVKTKLYLQPFCTQRIIEDSQAHLLLDFAISTHTNDIIEFIYYDSLNQIIQLITQF